LLSPLSAFSGLLYSSSLMTVMIGLDISYQSLILFHNS
jgi:hypothetical protein